MLARSPAVSNILLFIMLFVSACSEALEPDPLRIAVMIEAEITPARTRNFDWAVENINAAGGVAGRPLVLDYFSVAEADPTTLAFELAEDDNYLAVVAPPGSVSLLEIADIFVEAGKPLLSTNSSADELLRAYAGFGEIWRLRESDLVQTELLVRFAREHDAARIALISDREVSTLTFSSWFELFATELGYSEDAVQVVTIDSSTSCTSAVMDTLDGELDMVFVAPSSGAQAKCIVDALSIVSIASTRPRIVFADTGLDLSTLLELGSSANGIEGFSAVGDLDFAEASQVRFSGVDLAANGPSEYDTILLLAYGLERSAGIGGTPLIAGMKATVDGREASVGAWDSEGIAATLTALRAGQDPLVRGATGDLVFEPEVYMDLAASTLAHFVIDDQTLRYDQRYTTGDSAFLTSEGVFSGQSPESDWTPAVAKTDTWAVIAALSSGWDNYRHQADALRQYQLLRAGGIADDHIVLILADDLADDPENDLAGQVRNELGGDDLYAGAVVDYDLSLGAADLANIISGQVTATTPTVIQPGPSSNIYLYFTGHGGQAGIPIGARTAAEGRAVSAETLSPQLLRERLCELQDSDSLRRTLVVIEACFAGAFGEAETGGLELGCGAEPLEGALLITAANATEVSYAGEFDAEVPAWVNDEFSQSFAREVELGVDRNLADVYIDSFRGTLGSHPSRYNAANAGQLIGITLAEFFT